jgi:LacI family transcriptional regulator, repressor for deo operon, udp, cdd, tsx, nupC, and nupG
VASGGNGVFTAGRPGEQRGVGILDVARHAGVSAATVSRALRGLPNVSRDTRTKVLTAADELGYAASPLASALATGRMRSVGVVLPQAGRWFFAEVLGGIEAALRRHGYDLVLHVLADDNRRAEFFGSLPVRRRVDALLLVSLAVSDAEAAVLHELGLPLAWVGEPVAGVHGELVDDTEAARLAVRHLVDLGHRRVAAIGGPLDGPRASAPAVRRTSGYREVLADAGLEARPEWLRDGEFTPDGARRAVLELFTQIGPDDEPPTALFCQSDEMAFGALGALRDLGLRCPEDVSVVGLDGHELAATFDLTTVAQPVQDLGAHAARWLVGRLAASPDDEDDEDDEVEDVTEDVDDTYEELRVHAVRLDVRGSTAPPRGRAQAVRSVASSG